MQIPLKAQVECTDGVCGRCVVVLMNPVVDQITHLVVREDAAPHTEYIVPVDVVSATTADKIGLRCSQAELEKMDRFEKTHYVEEQTSQMYPSFGFGAYYGLGTLFYWPFARSDRTGYVPEERQQIPPGDLAVHRGTRVVATDGDVGKVDEFLINPENGHITHLVMREGHLWGQKDVTIPLSAMRDARGDAVFLKLDKHQIESLPAVPVHRRWS